MNLHQAARALGGEVKNGKIVCPAPGHTKIDRSLAVWFSPDGGVHVNPLSPKDDWRDCKEYVRQRLGFPADGWRDTKPRERRPAPRIEPTKEEINQEKRRTEMVRRLWGETVDPRGTLAETYLARERGLPGVLDDRLAKTLRFHGSCHFRDGDALVRGPALIAALRDPRLVMGQCGRLGDLDEVERAILSDPSYVIAVQRIRLTQDGKKVERRSLGQMQNACVFVGSIWEFFYRAEACIGEGVETMLSMKALGFSACAALAGAGRFRSFTPPPHWAAITISGENDAGASESAWRAAGPRWAHAGHDVRVWTPPPGMKDANDLVLSKAREARAA
jgi:putative DNA primase/helicase